MRKVIRWGVRGAALALLVLATIVLVRAFDARRLPDLRPWHRFVPARELKAADLTDRFTLADYLRREDEIFAEVRQRVLDVVEPDDRTLANRYYRESLSSPSRYTVDWNRTFERAPPSPRAGAVLIHGLTDAPYSLRAMADALHGEGVYALVLRMPGHGTVPAGLIQAAWEDWMAAVRMGMRHVSGRVGPGKPVFLVGYSNGGALAVKYALDALDDPTLPRADRLVLLSPMIGVSPFARLAWLISLLGPIDYFEKSRWLDVLPEHLPFKYNSFPANAAEQTYRLTAALQLQLRAAAKEGRIDRLPPMLAFQSVVDSTVRTDSIVHELYEKLASNGSELVMFDLNRQSTIKPFIRASEDAILGTLFDARPRRYRLTLITNASPDTLDVVEKSTSAGASEPSVHPLGLAWPRNIFSLTHIALPFPPDDPVFGLTPDPALALGIRVGSIEPRGERNVLLVPVEQFMRLPCNPFYPYLDRRVREWVRMQLGDDKGMRSL
jgi:alpha-beta hydrolase superfamily lysophospholipase